MSFKDKDTFSKWGNKRSYSSLGKATNNRFSPGTWILRILANGPLLATFRTGEGGPGQCPSGSLSQRKSFRHVGNRTDAVCMPADKRVEWSADRHTGHC